MATVAETFTWAISGAALKTHLGVSGEAEDTMLERWLVAATQQADLVIDEDLAEAAEEQELDAAEILRRDMSIETGVFEWVRIRRTTVSRAVGLKSQKTGDLSEAYFDEANSTPLAITDEVADYWFPAKTDIVP